VLVELLNFFSEYGEKARLAAVTQAEGILSGANIEVAACETLTQVRKWSRTTPALQLNIAANGGQQVNLSS
jgi:hypothetical protein